MKKYRRLLLRLLVLACLIWGPSIYFGVIATIQAELLSEGRAYCWYVRKPLPPNSPRFSSQMLLTLDRSSPFRFWSNVFAFEQYDDVRPHFGIAIPTEVGSHQSDFFGWSYRKHSFWLIQTDYYSLSENGKYETCLDFLRSRGK